MTSSVLNNSEIQELRHAIKNLLIREVVERKEYQDVLEFSPVRKLECNYGFPSFFLSTHFSLPRFGIICGALKFGEIVCKIGECHQSQNWCLTYPSFGKGQKGTSHSRFFFRTCLL